MQHNPNFGDLPDEYSGLPGASVVVVPVPYDMTSTWIKGADKGPGAIIKASGNVELYDMETDTEVFTRGIYTDVPVACGEDSPETMVQKVFDRVEGHIRAGRFVVVIGGEHSVSIGSIKAHAKKYEKLTVLQLDAHSDSRDQYEGSKYNHACVMARAMEKCEIVQVGIRSMDVSERSAVMKERIFPAGDIYNNVNWHERAIEKLSEDVYITIDLDVFDSSVMPSTGTPEPGGLFWYDVAGFMRKVFLERNVVGFDVVELCPSEANRAPDFLAAKLIYKLLSYRFGQQL